MKKKFPAKDIRILTDEAYMDELEIEDWPKIAGELRVISIGEWEVYGLDSHYRESILQDIPTDKYYMFKEEADVAIDTFITVWENYPDMLEEEIELDEVTSIQKTVTVWKNIQE